jgi:hypothetical protein
MIARDGVPMAQNSGWRVFVASRAGPALIHSDSA